jgi:histidyl-tRNA synthetase
MAKLQPVRGTRDIFGEDMRRQHHVVETAREVAALYGYQEIATPIFEFSEVFKRTLGDTSDIVTKEMYSFTDNGGEHITLRPENTAGVARAVISGGLAQNVPLKFFYAGPMFRYERPQKGRYRQFHQIGIELIGVSEPLGDIEVIAAGAQILDRLGVLRHTTLELNTLGDSESRAAYRSALVEYLRGHVDKLSADSRTRLDRNPLRILDSKDEGDIAIVRDAPQLKEFLNEPSRRFFDDVRRGLDKLGIEHVWNPYLVRGLDYYAHTAFEFKTDQLGAQGAVLAGGRYDGLISQMGGPPLPGVGWAAGIERLAMLLAEAPAAPRPIAIVPIGAEAEDVALKLSWELRRDGIYVEMGYRGNVSKRMKDANKMRARAAILIGEDELKRGAATVRDLDSGEQTEVPLTALKDRLAPYR